MIAAALEVAVQDEQRGGGRGGRRQARRARAQLGVHGVPRGVARRARGGGAGAARRPPRAAPGAARPPRSAAPRDWRRRTARASLVLE